MTDPNDQSRPRDYALEQELESLREQQRAGHSTPEQERRIEQLERRLHADEHAAERQERRDRDRGDDDQEERARHRR
jgi:hypothetical protein